MESTPGQSQQQATQQQANTAGIDPQAAAELQQEIAAEQATTGGSITTYPLPDVAGSVPAAVPIPGTQGGMPQAVALSPSNVGSSAAMILGGVATFDEATGEFPPAWPADAAVTALGLVTVGGIAAWDAYKNSSATSSFMPTDQPAPTTSGGYQPAESFAPNPGYQPDPNAGQATSLIFPAATQLPSNSGGFQIDVLPSGIGGFQGAADTGAVQSSVMLNQSSDGVPVPSVNVADNFSRTSYGDGTVQYTYLDPDNGHGLVMVVDPKGTLGFSIRAQGDSSTLGSGTDVFASGMQRLAADGVQVNAIRGYWIEGSDSLNQQQYVQNLQTMSPQQAAANTWTGNMAARYGYTNVGEPVTIWGNTSVTFTKPQ